MAAATILVVEDEPDITKILGMIFRKNGYGIVIATNGEEGIVEYKKSRPSLILTDIFMPKINGVEFIAYIRAVDKEIPIIALTGHPDVNMAVMLARDYILSDFLVKPVDSEPLLHSVREALARRHQSPLKKLLSQFADATAQLLTIKDQPPAQVEQKEKESSESRLSEYRTVMAAFAHDLKNEFSRMALITKSFVTSRSLDDEEMIAIKLGVEYGQILVRRFLNFLDMGLSPPQPLNIVEVVRKAEDIVRPRLRPNVQFALAINLNPPLQDFRVIANSDQLLLILVDLIRNAGDAIGSQCGVITLSVLERDNAVAVSVSDNGPGIPLSLKEQLFKAPLKRQGGVGLGLYLASKILKSWNGRILLDETAKGTTMIISLQRVSKVDS